MTEKKVKGSASAGRPLEIDTLDGAARDYAAHFVRRSVMGPDKLHRAGRDWVLESLFNAHFKDEHEYIVKAMLDGWLPPKAKAEFEAEVKKRFTPRDDAVFHALLKERLAITPDGDHIEGCIGKVELGNRIVGGRVKIVRDRKGREHVLKKNVYWPIYAGEEEERQRPGGGAADPLPEPTGLVATMMANVTNISAESAIAAIDAVADKIDEGNAAGEIRGRTGSQPNDPDATETGTLLFTLPMSDPAFNAGADDTDGTVSAAADTITDDSSADATNTLTYCRMAATGTGADDHVDGNAGTSDEAFVFNTVSIVSGSTVSMTSCTLGMSQGSTAA